MDAKPQNASLIINGGVLLTPSRLFSFGMESKKLLFDEGFVLPSGRSFDYSLISVGKGAMGVFEMWTCVKLI